MVKYLIDVNLPYYFSLWNTPEYVHQIDINPKEKDKDIWQCAIENNLTVISKDSDFPNRILFNELPPKVIHIKIGNVGTKELYQLINHCWNEVLLLNASHKLVNVYKDKIEGIK